MLLGISWAGLLPAQSPLPLRNALFLSFCFRFVVHAEGIEAKETQDS